MPIYEYEPDDRECLICPGRVEVLQSASEKPLKYCPVCGLSVRRVVSQVSFTMHAGVDEGKAANKGFTTYRKAEAGVYERTAGDGPEIISRDSVDRVVDSDGD